MKTLIKNATLISMDDTRPKMQQEIDVLVENDKIAEIGRQIEARVDNTIDAKNRVLLPGLINTHAHVPMSIFREIADGCPLQEWLEEKIWPIEAKLLGEDIYNASILTFKEMIETGTTTVNDQYFMTEHIIKAALEKQIRIELTRVLMDADNDGETRIKEFEELIEKYKDVDEKISLSLGIHGLYTCSPEYVKRATDLARKYNLTIHMHFCENTKEVEDIKRIHNVQNPSEVLEKYFYGTKAILAHCVKLSQKDMEVIKKLNFSVAHCPISNLRLGCGIANIEKMREMGINITLGTDGQGSGSNMDMFETMKFAALLQKGEYENPIAMPAFEVLKMATINGAKALRKDNEIGSIEIGKKADLILLDLNGTTTTPINDIFADIIYNAKGSNIKLTMINGKILNLHE